LVDGLVLGLVLESGEENLERLFVALPRHVGSGLRCGESVVGLVVHVGELLPARFSFSSVGGVL
jgi:hypothetical protein